MEKFFTKLLISFSVFCIFVVGILLILICMTVPNAIMQILVPFVVATVLATSVGVYLAFD